MIHPNFLDKGEESERNYREGDLLKISQGLTMWKWVGTVDSENYPAEGYYLREGLVDRDFAWYYDGSEWKSYIAIEEIVLSAEKEIFVGEKTEMKVGFFPGNGTLVGGRTKFYTKTPDIASVDEQGNVYGLAAGTAEIVAVAEDLFAGRFSGSVYVTVREKTGGEVLKAEILPFAFRTKRGEEPDLSGLSVLFTYTDGRTETKLATDPVLTGFDKTQVGIQICKLSYEAYGVRYESEIRVTVTEKETDGCGSAVNAFPAWLATIAVFPLFRKLTSRRKEYEK